MASGKRLPRPPFVEPGFYFADRSTDEALFLVVDHLLSRGATLAGEALVGEPGDPDELADLTYNQVERIAVRDRSDLTSARSAGRSIAEVTLADVGAGSSGRHVQVRVLPIPPEAVGRDHHPIAIWCDGQAFEPYATPAAKKKAATGVLELFRSALTALSPSYGAILVEWPLPGPTEIGQRPDGFQFADFYLSAGYVEPRRIRRIAELVGPESHTELPDGSLFLTSGLFAPGKVEGVGKQAAQAIVATAR